MNWELKTFKKDIDINGLYTFFYLEHTKDFYFAGERHDFWEMVYVDMGEISAIAENDGYMIHQGEVIFHKPMEFHALASNKKDPHNVMIITFSTNSDAIKFFENKIFTLESSNIKLLSSLLKEGRKAFISDSSYKVPEVPEKTEIGSAQLLINYLEQFLIFLLRSNYTGDRKERKSPHAKKNAEDALVDSIERYLSESIYENITLDHICKRFNMSKSYICQLFKTATGSSVIDTYIHLKISEAKKLIRKGDLNFTQISEALGYSSIHHFTRSFKSIEGITPSSYEKSVK